MEGLALQIQAKDAAGTEHWEWVTLDDDTSITIEMSSPIFGTGATFSYPFTIPVEPNRHIIGNADQIHGAHLHDILHKRPARFYLCGIPFRRGVLRLDKEVEITEGGKLEMEFTSERGEWEEIIEGLNARDVELLNRFQIGYAVADKTIVTVDVNEIDTTWPDEGLSKDIIRTFHLYPEINLANLFSPKDKNGRILVNLGEPFNPNSPTSYPYCTMRVCVQKRQTKDGGDKENSNDEEEVRGYNVLEYDRLNTGICMYVGYFLRCLFTHLRIVNLGNSLEDIEDFCRLFFLNTQCHYEVVEGLSDANAPDLQDLGVSIDFGRNDDGNYREDYYLRFNTVPSTNVLYLNAKRDIHFNTSLFPAYATSDNFPDKEVKEIIDAIEKAFGARFIYDSHAGTVRVTLLRDVFRDSSVQEFHAEIRSRKKKENNIRGVRLTYGESTDTAFNYTDYKNLTDFDDYHVLIGKISAHDKRLYYDSKTGRWYRIKVDEKAKSEDELHPALFEVGQFGDSEDGECSDDETTEVITMGFMPGVMNDTAFQDEVKSSSRKQEFAYYVDGAEIHVADNLQKVSGQIRIYSDGGFIDVPATPVSINGVVGSTDYHADIPFIINYATGQNWSMADSEEGPFQDYDTGLTFCINRGPGSEGSIEYYDEDYDGEGNCRWIPVSGNYASHHDTCDNYGNHWDYNGVREGVQDGVDGEIEGRFSLCLRAEKPNPNYDPSHPDGETTTTIISTGGTETVTTRERAAEVIRILYPSRADRLLVHTNLTGNELIWMGWVSESQWMESHNSKEETVPLFPVFYDITDSQGVLHHAMLTPRDLTIGSLASKDNLDYFTRIIQGKSITEIECYNSYGGSMRRPIQHYIVSYDATSADGETLVSLLDLYDGKSSTPVIVTLPDETITTTTVNSRYLPITDPLLRRRGISDQFYAEYIYWLLHARTMEVELDTELAELQAVDMTKHYRIDDVIGLFKKITFHADKEGIHDIIGEVAYL